MKYVELALNEEVSYWVNHNLKNYLEKSKNVENVSEIEHAIDYLNSADAPKRLRKMSYREAIEASKRWLKTQIKKGSDLEEVEDVDFEVVLDFNDGFKLVLLKSELAYKREGFLMGHCVASFFGRDSKVYSLRDSRNMPHCTMNLAGTFDQCKGKGNGPVHVKYVKYILDSLEHFGVDIKPREMSYLGYMYLDGSGYSDNQVSWFKKHFKEFIKFKGNTYYYLGA